MRVQVKRQGGRIGGIGQQGEVCGGPTKQATLARSHPLTRF